jgi:hypothetical protein
MIVAALERLGWPEEAVAEEVIGEFCFEPVHKARHQQVRLHVGRGLRGGSAVRGAGGNIGSADQRQHHQQRDHHDHHRADTTLARHGTTP